jgi:nitroimidazol reductase NimA-like FMN-containing flavoprotein (pyridoxamine 5'-phosphate oxidase superfamily)
MVMNEMTEQECKEALARTSFGRLAYLAENVR